MTDLIEQIQAALSEANYASRMDIGGDPLCVFTMSFEMQRGEYVIQIQGAGETEEQAVAAAIHHLAKAYYRSYAGLGPHVQPQVFKQPRTEPVSDNSTAYV